APAVLLDQLTIRELPLRILVQHLHVAVCGSVIEIEVIFLYVLTVIALARGQAEHPLFQDGIFAVPERHREAQQLITVTDAGDSILAPAIRLAARLVVCQVIPGCAVWAIVFADTAPGALADIWPPLPPGRNYIFEGSIQALLFSGPRSNALRGRRLFDADLNFYRALINHYIFGQGSASSSPTGTFCNPDTTSNWERRDFT